MGLLVLFIYSFAGQIFAFGSNSHLWSSSMIRSFQGLFSRCRIIQQNTWHIQAPLLVDGLAHRNCNKAIMYNAICILTNHCTSKSLWFVKAIIIYLRLIVVMWRITRPSPRIRNNLAYYHIRIYCIVIVKIVRITRCAVPPILHLPLQHFDTHLGI